MSANPYVAPPDTALVPSSVRAVRILLWIVCGLTLITALDVWFLVGGSYGLGAALFLVPPAAASLAAARLTLAPRRRTWWLIVFLQVIYIFWQLSRIPQGDPFVVLGLAFPVAILVSGTRPAARRYFRGERRAGSRPAGMARLWAGDSGASFVSYLAVVLLVTTVSVAMVATDLPVRVSGGIETVVCGVTGGDHCDPIQTADKGTDVQIAASNADGGAAPPAPSVTAPKGDDDDGDSPDCLLHIGWYCEANDGLVQSSQTAVSGTGHLIGFVTCLIPVCGFGHAGKNWSSLGKGLGHLFTTNPLTTVTDVWNGTTKPIRDDWNSGHKARAVGRTFGTTLSVVFGGNGLGQLRKVAAAEKAAKKAEEAEKAAKAAKSPHYRPGRGSLGEPIGQAEKSLRQKAQRVPWRQQPGVVQKLDHVGASVVHKVDLGDGAHGAYKADMDGPATWKGRPLPVGGLANRAVAFYRMDQMFRFNRVGTTTIWDDGPRGRGSLMEWEENSSPGRALHFYTIEQRQQMALDDYIGGNTDRWRPNYLTRSPRGPDPNGLAAIDHDFSFPDTTVRAIRSDFVLEFLERPLSADVLAKIRAVKPKKFRKMLRASGLGDKAADWSVARLIEVQERGMITGEAWPGGFDTGDVPQKKVPGWPRPPRRG